jgi:pimeloyl-ACP methyl ester carboxylesterase
MKTSPNSSKGTLFFLSSLALFQCSTTSAFLTPTSPTLQPQGIYSRTNDVIATVSSSPISSSSLSSLSSSLTETPIKEQKNQGKVQRYYESFEWTNPTSKQTHTINYKVQGKTSNPPILLTHGFGANVNHFRYNFPALVDAGYCVYAVDLLGFGGSDKPKDEEYCIEMWVDLLSNFVTKMNDEVGHDKKWVVAGNSIGGLCSLGVAANPDLRDQIRGITLFNCAGGMTGFRYEEIPLFLKPILVPLLYFVQKVVLSPDGYGGKFFSDFKTRENVESILMSQGVYGDTKNVDEELLEILLGPSDDDGAKEVFLKVFGGPAGPTPESLMPKIDVPILALWGSADPWTPVDKGLHPGSGLAQYAKGDFDLRVLDGAGHCPHDECPDEIHQNMIPWLKDLPLQ